MPISSLLPAPRPVLTPREITTRHRLAGRPGRPASARPCAAEAGVQLALSEPPPGDATALRHAREWEAHVDAGRIGVPAPAPTPGPGAELRFASLAAMLGHDRGRVW